MTTEVTCTEDFHHIDLSAPLQPLHEIPSIPEIQATHTPYQQRVRFIQALAQGHTVTWACRYAGSYRTTVYDWKRNVPSFSDVWDDVVNNAGGDIWEDRLHAISQSDKHLGAAVTATIVGLKMRKRFVENAPSGDRPVQVQIINVMRGEQTSESIKIDDVPMREALQAPSDNSDSPLEA